MDISEIGTFSAITFKALVYLKLKFWGYNKKNITFHLTPKKYYFQLSPRG